MTDQSKQIVIRLNPGEDYRDNLLGRLERYKLTKLAVSEQMGIPATQLSRWFRKDDDGEYINELKFESVLAIENAILRLRFEQQRKK